MVSRDHNLSVRRQCGLLFLTRSNLYYQPKGESAQNLRFMKIVDKQFLDTPWYGSRQMARYMQRQGHECGRRHAGSVPPERRAPLDAADALGADLSDAKHKQEAPPAQELSIFAKNSGD